MSIAIYILSPPTLNDGEQRQLLLDSAGNLKTVSGGTGTTANQVQGNVAAAAADSGNPVKIGGVYNTASPTYTNGQRGDIQLSQQGEIRVQLSNSGIVPTTPTLGADGESNSSSVSGLRTYSREYAFNGTTWDRVRGDTNGIVVQSALSSTFWNYAAATGGIVNTTTAVTIKAAAGASIRNFLQTLTIGHDTLGGATEIAIRDGAAGTVLWRGKLQTAAKEDTAFFFDPPLKGTANTLMEVVTLTAVTGGVFVNAQGFTGA